MKITSFLILIPALLTGCASLMPLEDGLTPFKGQPINHLFSVIGFPDDIELIDNEITYRYQIIRSHTDLVTETERATGLEGQDPLIAKTMMQPTQVNVECELTVITDTHKTIKRWRYKEAYKGCTPYREKLAAKIKQ